MLEIGGKDVGWLTETMEKLEKAQKEQDAEKLWGSREREGVECLTYHCFTHHCIKASSSPSLVHGVICDLLEEEDNRQGTLTDSCSKTTWSGDGGWEE